MDRLGGNLWQRSYGFLLFLPGEGEAKTVMILPSTVLIFSIKYGDVFTYVMFGVDVTVALGAKGNNFVLGGNSKALSAEDAYTVSSQMLMRDLLLIVPFFKHLTTPVFGKDVVYDVPNEVFMEQKKFVKFGLSTDNFRAYVGMIEEEVENFLATDPVFRVWQLNDINEWGQFDALKAMAEITILTASRTLQGKEVRASLDKSFADLYNDLDGGFTPINFLFPNLPLESYRKRDRAQKKMSDFYVDIIKKRRQGDYDVSSSDLDFASLHMLSVKSFSMSTT